MLSSDCKIRAGSEALGSHLDDMDTSPLGRSVWRSEELGFSPKTCEPPLGAAFVDSGESSEDWEDYASSLAEEIAQSMLEDDEEPGIQETIAAPKAACSSSQMACSPTSPQSTLAGLGGYNWEGSNPEGSSSGLSSPPTPVAAGSSHKGDAGVVDGLYAELLRLKLEGEMKPSSERWGQVLSRQEQIIKRPTSISVMDNTYARNRRSTHTPIPDGRCHQVVSGSKLQVGAWGTAAGATGGFSKSRGSGSGRSGGDGAGVGGCHYRGGAYSNGSGDARRVQHFSFFASDRRSNEGKSSSSGGQQQQQARGGMRAVFLGSRDASCGGTGVFLPRRLGSFQDSKRKPACSTVLLPSRVVHALNLSVEDTLPSHLRRDEASWSHTPSAKVASKEEKASLSSPHSIIFQEIAPDIHLPSEWMY